MYHLCPLFWIAVDDTTGGSETPTLILDIGTEVKKFKTPVDVQELRNQARERFLEPPQPQILILEQPL